ncbi:MAG: DUF262 domain-containing protein, partial [Alphaproteobacteria bacterium]
MKATRKKVTIKDLIKGYDDGYARGEEEKGIVGYDGKLDIRPPYQRNFIYEDKQRADVIKSILADLPLNVMYWAIKDDGNYEILDGQQRTISICQYVKTEEFSYKNLSFHNQPDNIKKKILASTFMIYVFKGTAEDKLAWFKTINLAGANLTHPEMRH